MSTARAGSRLAWTALFAYSVAIFVQSSFPGVRVTARPVPGLDKILHFGAFALWAWIFAVAFGRSRPHESPWRCAWIAAVAATVYGLSDEIHQAFVTGREADLLDLVADAAGGVFGGCLCAFWRRRRGR